MPIFEPGVLFTPYEDFLTELPELPALDFLAVDALIFDMAAEVGTFDVTDGTGVFLAIDNEAGLKALLE